MKNDEKKFVEETFSLINKDFSIDVKNNYTYENLKQFLVTHIKNLLANDFERLINILYRIDVDEKQFYDALNNADHSEVASQIADLVLKREMEKVKWRNSFSSKE